MTWPIRVTAAGLRRSLCGLFAATALGGAVATTLTTSSATAAPDPCAVSQIAKTVGTVATNTGTYLDSHPETNQALTTMSQQQAGPQTFTALKTYFDANPQTGKDLEAIQQPLTDISTQCKLPVSLPQLLGLLQTAQSGGLPATPPEATAAAQNVAATQGSSPLPTTTVVAVPTGHGPVSGPGAATAQ